MKKEYYLYGVIIALLILNIVNYNKIDQLETLFDDIQNLRAEIEVMNDSVQGVSAIVDEKINQLEEKNSWVQDKKTDTKNFDLKNKTITLSLDWKLKELMKNESLSFFYRVKGDTKWSEVKMTSNRSLSFNLVHTFLTNKNYETKIVGSSTEGVRSEEFGPLDFSDLIENHVTIDSYVTFVGDKHFDLNIQVYNPLRIQYVGFVEGFALAKAKALVYVEGKLTDEIDLLKQSDPAKPDPEEQSLHHNSTIIGSNDDKIEVIIQIEDRLGNKYESKTNPSN